MERYTLEQSRTEANKWVCTDTVNGIVCTFEHGNFNENQLYEVIGKIPSYDAQDLARIAREMGDWLRDNHYNKIF